MKGVYVAALSLPKWIAALNLDGTTLLYVITHGVLKMEG